MYKFCLYIFPYVFAIGAGLCAVYLVSVCCEQKEIADREYSRPRLYVMPKKKDRLH